MFLTQTQLEELTGYRRPSGQKRWLTEKSYPFEVGGDGKIKVLASVVEGRLGGRIERTPQLRLSA